MRDRSFNLSCRRAVVIGNGNVALDVAPILVADPVELACTPPVDHALPALESAGIRAVVVLRRRGSAQAAFTALELRALDEVPAPM